MMKKKVIFCSLLIDITRQYIEKPPARVVFYLLESEGNDQWILGGIKSIYSGFLVVYVKMIWNYNDLV